MFLDVYQHLLITKSEQTLFWLLLACVYLFTRLPTKIRILEAEFANSQSTKTDKIYIYYIILYVYN